MHCTRVSKTEFKARALELFRLSQELGERIIITDNGKPVLEMAPYRKTRANALDLLQGSVLRYIEPTGSVDVEWIAAE